MGEANFSSPPRIITDESVASLEMMSPSEIVSPPQSSSSQSQSKAINPNLLSIHNYQYSKVMGEGAFSTVILVRERTSGKLFAMKMCNKDEAVKKKIVERLRREKNILSKLKHPLIPQLIACFTTREDVVFVLTLALRGDMAPFLKRLGSFDMNCTKFYISEVVLALEYLHSQRILHRDLKPVNILLKHDYHILLTDYGTAKDLNESPVPVPVAANEKRGGGKSAECGSGDEHSRDEEAGRGRKSSFVGSPQFVSPEVLQNKAVTEACDYFALGSIIFQFLAGEAPFSDETEYLMFYKVLNLDYSFPEGFPPVATDIVQKLLVLDHEKRLGHPNMGGCGAVKQHPFFQGINFETIISQKPPKLRPFLPASNSCGEELYSEMPQLSELTDDDQGDNLTWFDRPIDVFKGFDDSNELTSSESTPNAATALKSTSQPSNMLLQLMGVGNISHDMYRAMLRNQREGTPWDVFAKDRLIIKMGLLDKRVGYFSRRRMFLFLQGPLFIYIDPKNKESKGEIKWCDSLTPELKNDKIFFIHVPGRVYYLIDPEGHAKDWVDTIIRVKSEVAEAKKQLSSNS